MFLKPILPFIAIGLFLLALLFRRREVGASGWLFIAGYCYFEASDYFALEEYFDASVTLVFITFSLLLAFFLVKTSENEDLFLFRTDIRLEEDLNKGILTEKLKKVFKTNGFSLSDSVTIAKRKENEWVIADEKMGYLFSIGAGLEDDLNKSTVPEELRNICKAKKLPLSDNATITKGKENEWVIADEEKFIVRKEARKLNLYKMRKFFARKEDEKLNIYKDYKVLDLFFLVTKIALITAVFYFPFSEISSLSELLIYITTKITATMLNLFNPGSVYMISSFIYPTSTSFEVEIILACTAIQSMVLFTGLVFGVNAPMRRKLKAFFVSVPVIYGLNIIRNVFVVTAYFEQWFASPRWQWFLQWFIRAPPVQSFDIAHGVIARIGIMISLIVIAYAVFVILPEALDLVEDFFRFLKKTVSTRIKG